MLRNILRAPAAIWLIVVFLPYGASGQNPAYDAAVSRVAEQFFAAYSKKDLAGFLALWSQTSPDLAERQRTIQGLFANTDKIQLKAFNIAQVQIEDRKARVRVIAEITRIDLKTGRMAQDLGKMDRILYLVRENDGWKVWREAPADLFTALIQARTKQERLWLLNEERAQLTSTPTSSKIEESHHRPSEAERSIAAAVWIEALFSSADEKAAQGNYDKADHLIDVGLDIAEFIRDQRSIGWSHMHRGFVLNSRAQYPAALSQFRQALRIFQTAWVILPRSGTASSGALLISPGKENELETVRRLALEIERAEEAQEIERKKRALAAAKKIILFYQDQNVRESLKNDEANALSWIGKTLQSTGSYADAIRALEANLLILRDLRQSWESILPAFRELKIEPATFKAIQENEFGVLINLGDLYRLTGKPAEALKRLEAGLKMARELQDKGKEASVSNEIGLIRQTLRESGKARVRPR